MTSGFSYGRRDRREPVRRAKLEASTGKAKRAAEQSNKKIQDSGFSYGRRDRREPVRRAKLEASTGKAKRAAEQSNKKIQDRGFYIFLTS